VQVTQIGTEGGFLPAPVVLTNPAGGFRLPYVVGPAERADLIVDFSAVPNGTKVLLYNDAPAPFPGGAPIFDFYVGNKKNPAVTAPGFGPNSRTILQFRVNAAAPPPAPITLPATFPATVLPTIADPNGGLALNLLPNATWTAPDGKVYTVAGTQNLTLNEAFDAEGRLQQLVGTNVLNPAPPAGLVPGYGRYYVDDPPTEKVKYGTIEIWNIINLTADTHPMHVHLFNGQVLQRRKFNTRNFNGVPNFQGPGVGPNLNEIGMKETFQTHPGEVTRIAILIDDPMPVGPLGTGYTIGRDANGRPTVTNNLNAADVSTLPASARLAAYGPNANGVNWTNTDEYVWHCHILEHEEHDMMRVLGAAY
jgi:spore coat protein A